MAKPQTWWQRLTGRPAPRERSLQGIETLLAFVQSMGDDVDYTGLAFSELLHNAYLRSPAVYSCVSLIARTVGALPWGGYVDGDDGTLEAVELGRPYLTERPNPRCPSWALLTQELMTDLLIGGEAFLYGAWPNELWRLNPSAVQVKIDGGETVPRFLVNEWDGGQKELTPDDLLWLRLPHPGLDWRGLSPMVAAGEALNTERLMRRNTNSILRNGGVPAMVLEQIAEMMDSVIEGAQQEFVKVPYGASHEDVAAINDWHQRANECQRAYATYKGM
jgi:HK97 family phage portal protein